MTRNSDEVGVNDMTVQPITDMTSAKGSPHGLARHHGLWVLAILSALMGFASISTDLYLPAMPDMGRSLVASTGSVEWTVSGYLIGFSLGQLVWGPIGDRFGRRLPLALGMLLFVAGSACCGLAGTVWSMIVWRVVQAVGACAGVVLARAMVRDLYEGDRAAQMLSTLMTVMAIAPLLGPLVGGQILLFAGWRAIFWTLVGIGLLTLAALLTIPETLRADRRNPEPLVQAFARYGELLRNRAVLGYSGASGCFYGGMFAYVAGTPFAYINYYHVSAQLYGVLFAAGMVGIMATNLMNARVVRRIGMDRLLRGGTVLAALAGVVLAVAAWTGWGGLLGLFAPLFMFVASTGFIVANSIVGAMRIAPNRAGAMSALIGAIQYGSGMIGSALIGALADGTPWPMGIVIGCAGLGSAGCAWFLIYPKTS